MLKLSAMNSLGAGGEEKPYLVNGANALTFCLMVVSCFFSSVIVKKIGIKWALVFGTMGYAPYAAGLYTNNRYGTEWFVLFGAALCGISAGVFWMAEAAIALSYPEPYNQGEYSLTGFDMMLIEDCRSILGILAQLQDRWAGSRRRKFYARYRGDPSDRTARQSTLDSMLAITKRAKCRTTSTWRSLLCSVWHHSQHCCSHRHQRFNERTVSVLI